MYSVGRFCIRESGTGRRRRNAAAEEENVERRRNKQKEPRFRIFPEMPLFSEEEEEEEEKR
jgi:hypothetical protein